MVYLIARNIMNTRDSLSSDMEYLESLEAHDQDKFMVIRGNLIIHQYGGLLLKPKISVDEILENSEVLEVMKTSYTLRQSYGTPESIVVKKINIHVPNSMIIKKES
jgi:hypothetical protein